MADASWKDLALLMQFLVEKHPGYRLEIHSIQNTDQYRADLDKYYGYANNPEDAVVTVALALGHTEQEFQQWVLGPS